jgi:cellulose synthase/poly-beta-1,6-N-acetylglucosamine synthase-like glycosyltransferase
LIILPVYNEQDTIDRVLESLLAQDYGGPLQIVVADGGSDDGTTALLGGWARRDQRVRLVDNPHRRQSPGLNAAAAIAAGDYLVRADGHTRYAPDYVRRSIETLEASAADAAGGRMNPVGTQPFGLAVAAAMNSRLTMGPARFHHADRREEVDTVYLGAFSRGDFAAVGGFRSFPSGAAEDADFYHRWRQSGRTVVVDPEIHSTYTPRQTPGALASQYFRYGQGKTEMLWANGRFPSWRPWGPLLLVLGIIIGIIIWLTTGFAWPLLVLLGAWLIVIGFVAVRAKASWWRVFVAAGIMHLTYGCGLLWGLVRGPGPVRRSG